MPFGVHAWSVIGILVLGLVLLQPAYANGDDLHVGGIFLVLVGGVVFFGSLVVVLYMLLRSPPDDAEEAEEGTGQHHDDSLRGD